MTNSNTMAELKEADERKRIRRMALATITANIGTMIGVLILAYVFLYFIGLTTYLAQHHKVGSQPDPQESIDDMVAAWHLTKPMIPAIMAIILFSNYRHGIQKARKLKKMKEHAFVITWTKYRDTYDISGTMTIAGAEVEYSTRLYEEELNAFEQL